MEGIAEAVRQDGFAVVRGLLGPEARRRVLEEEARLKAQGTGGWMDRLGQPRRDRPLVWSKDRAVRSPAFRALGAGEAVLSLVRPVLGEDVVLWGTDVLVRPPSRRHPWHSDIESCDPGGGFLSVWIGIEGTTARSSLHLVAGSHRLGTTVQEQAQRHGRGRGEAGDEEVMGWARALDPSVRLERPALCDGERAVAAFRRWREVWDVEGHPEEGQFRLLPLVHANMARLGVEDPVMPRLRGIHRYSWCEAQRRRHVALGALRALRDAGIGCMALKGLALGLAYYDDPALRPMADLDLLVRPEEVAAAQRALLAAGWSCKAPDLSRSRAVRGHYLVRYIEMAFRNGRDEVDLHWHPLKERPTPRLDEAFWSGAGTIRMEETRWPAPRPRCCCSMSSSTGCGPRRCRRCAGSRTPR